MQRGRGGHGHGGKSPKGKGPFQKIRKPDLRPKTVPISKRIRDVTRLLKKPDLDPAVRAAQEKKLAALTEELEQRKRVALERKYAVRYHKIRFFERVKLERRLAKLSRQQGSDGLSPAEETEMRQLVEDLQYVLNFPKGEKYISILKKAEDPEAQAHLEAERARLRISVQQQMAEAALIGEADEGRSLAAEVANNNAKRKSEKSVQDKTHKKKTKRSQQGEESDDDLDDDVGEEDAGDADSEEEKDDFFLFGSEDEGEENGKAAAEDAKEVEYSSEEEEEDEEEGAAMLSSGDEDDEEFKDSGSEEEEEEEEQRIRVKPRNSTQDRGPERKFSREGSGGGGRFGSGGRGRGRGAGGYGENRNKSKDPAPFRGLGGTKPVAKPPSAKKKPISPNKKLKVENVPLRKRAQGGRKRRKKN